MRRQLSRGETEEEKVKEKAYTEKKRMGNRKCREIYVLYCKFKKLVKERRGRADTCRLLTLSSRGMDREKSVHLEKG